MKKRILSLLLGGVLAVSSLALQPSVTVKADEDFEGWENWAAGYDCKGFTDVHVKSYNVAVINGQLTLGIELNTTAGNEEIGCEVYVCDQELAPVKVNGKDCYDFKTAPAYTVKKNFYSYDIIGGNYVVSCAFEGLAADKTYYVYCMVYDSHKEPEYVYCEHYYGMYLGSGAPTDASVNNASDNSQAAEPSYENTVVPGTPAVYEVKSGDYLNKIAKANNMTLAELLAKNPEIKDANKIWPGQKINL